MKFFWFGDSWVVGDELDLGKDATFAKLTSDYFNAECVNLGECGSSVDAVLWQFYKIKEQVSPGDIMFFCLTANHRVSLFDQDKSLKHIIPGVMYEKHNPHVYKDHWFKYFDTPAQRIFNYDKVINLLFLQCQHLNIHCYFANIFTAETNSIIDIVPKEHWLIAKNSCLAQCILPVISQNGLLLDDCPELTTEEWKKQEPLVKKYIRPNWHHPNALGHKKISELIIESLINKNEYTTR
jgi:hypothetical protein